MAAAPESNKSALEELKKLQAERVLNEEATAKIMEFAKAEILAKGELVITELKELGLDYRFVPGKAVRTPNPEQACPICNFKTNPPHDRRKHRNQTPKKPFSEADLRWFKLTKVV